MESINVEERVQEARRLFSEGYNCAQSVLLAYTDVWGIEPSFAATIVAPFGGGIGKMREVCDYIYDPVEGDPDGGIDPGTAFEDIPDDWVCPLCGVGKDDFEPVE